VCVVRVFELGEAVSIVCHLLHLDEAVALIVPLRGDTINAGGSNNNVAIDSIQ